MKRREAYKVWRDVTTRWADNDAYGHVNNTIHYSWFDTAVNGWLIEASGVDIRRLDAIGLVVETSCRYHAELEFPGTVTAGLSLERLVADLGHCARLDPAVHPARGCTGSQPVPC